MEVPDLRKPEINIGLLSIVQPIVIIVKYRSIEIPGCPLGHSRPGLHRLSHPGPPRVLLRRRAHIEKQVSG